MNTTRKSLSLITLSLVSCFSSKILYAQQDLGIKMGAFTLTPSLESHNEWKSNIYSSQKNTFDDIIFHTKPSVTIKSNWSNHLLAFAASSDIQNYATYDHEDRNAYSMSLGGKLDITRNNFMYTKLTYSNQYESRGAPDSMFRNSLLGGFIALTPTNYDLITSDIGYEHKFNRLKLSFDNNIQHYGYHNSKTANGTIIQNDRNRSRLQNSSTIKVAYEIASGYDVFMRGTYNTVDYDSNDNSTGGNDENPPVHRSSNGYNINAGIALISQTKLSGEAHIGYQERAYQDTHLKPISSITGGVSLKWQATGLTDVNLNIEQNINETAQQGSSGYLSMPITLAVNHELLRNIKLNASYNYTINNYTGGGENGSNRAEDVQNFSFGVKYIINRYLYLNGGYSFSTRKVNVTNSNYDISTAYLTLGLKY